jgi:hypothetical protein
VLQPEPGAAGCGAGTLPLLPITLGFWKPILSFGLLKKLTIQIQLKKGMLFSGNPTLSSGCMKYMLRIC